MNCLMEIDVTGIKTMFLKLVQVTTKVLFNMWSANCNILDMSNKPSLLNTRALIAISTIWQKEDDCLLILITI